MMKNAFAFVVAGFAAASAAEAATITYSVTAGSSAGTYNVYVRDSTEAGNYGIAGYNFTLAGFNTLTVRAPIVTFVNPDDGTSKQAGFSVLPSANDSAASFGTQDNVSGNGILAYGIGQTAGNLGSLVPANYTSLGGSRSTYGVPVLVATGTFSGNTLPVLVSGEGSTFTDNASNRSLANPNPTIVLVQGGAVPEPASLAVLGLAGLGVLARRRKTA